MKLKYPVRLLVVDRGPAEAAALVATLRRARYVVVPALVKDLDAVRDAARAKTWDLVLIGHDVETAPIADVVEVLRAVRSEAPVIVLEDDAGAGGRETRIAALRNGVHDVVPRAEPEMLEHTVRRELAALEHRRRVAAHRRTRREEARALAWLVEQSRAPLAVIRRSDIVAANDAFLGLFGIESFESPMRAGLPECVSEADRDALRTYLEGADGVDERPVQIELEARRRDGDTFPALLDVAAEIGADVPFLVRGGSAIVEGRGERLTPHDRAPELHAAILTTLKVLVHGGDTSRCLELSELMVRVYPQATGSEPGGS